MANNRFTLTSYDPVYVTSPEVRIPEEDIRAQAVRWLELNVCKNGEKPRMTDAWIKQHVEGIDTVEQLMAFIRFNMYKDNREAQKLADQDAICRELATRLVEELPQDVVQNAIYDAHLRFDDMIRRNGMTLEQFCQQRNTTPEQIDRDLEQRTIESMREDSALEAYADSRHYTLEAEDYYAVIPGDSIQEKAYKRQRIEQDGRLQGLTEYALKVKALNEIMENAMIRRTDDVEYVRYGDVSSEVARAIDADKEGFVPLY
ncbi:MAG: hypothetical protein SOV74_08930 [Coriobacteriales bacterium]|nr:hypothetical protein [Coriobacteriales bacterium]